MQKKACIGIDKQAIIVYNNKWGDYMDKKDRTTYFRQYRDANRQRITEYNRNYYRNNKLKNYKRLAAYYKRKAEELEKQEVNNDASD